MAHQMTITLSDDEYAALTAEAARSAQSAEALLHETVARRFSPPAAPTPPMTTRELLERLYDEGLITNTPTDEPDTPEEEAAAESLAQQLGGGKPNSEMIIEDRGPY
jgi:hypothetical protein